MPLRYIPRSRSASALIKAPSLLLLALLLGLSAAPEAQTTLAPGDIAVIGYSSDDNDGVAEEDDEFALLALVDIEVGTEIFITDKGVAADGTIQASGESIRGFTTEQAISAGEVFVFSRRRDDTQAFPAAFGAPTSGGSSFGIGLSTSGDQIIVYQENGDDTNTYIYALSATPFDAAFDAATGSSTDTALPPGLTNGMTAIDFEDDASVDNVYYDRTAGTSGTRAQILTLASNDDNYVQENSGDGFVLATLLGTDAFTVMASGGGASPGDLIVTGIADGDRPGGLPKAIELYVVNDIADLSVFALGSANNGGGTDGPELALSGSATAGQFIYAASETPDFTAFFGFAPDFDASTTTNAFSVSVNGDDAVELFYDAAGFPADLSTYTGMPSVTDTFGDIDTDGTGEAWEYSDGWVYRVNGTGPDGSTFVTTNWIYGGVGALNDAPTNVEAPRSFPIGMYSTTPSMEPQTFTALARGEFEVPAVETEGKGGITAVLDGTMLTVTGAFAYLESDYNANVGAHLHGGAADENGPVVIALTPTLDMDNRGGFFAAGENMFTVRETFADSIRTGLVYFNLHTVDNASGEIRGQLGMNADALPVALSGDQEVPPFETDASGTATVTVEGAMVTVTGSFMGLTGDYQASHVHAGARGANGPVIFGLDPTVPMAMPRSGEWEAANNMFEVRTTFSDSLRAGLAYINVHSDASPSGEIRGQVGFAGEMDVEPMAIADVRAGGDDQQVTILGVVTRSQGRITYVQDDTAALAIFQTSGDFRDAVDSGAIASGDSLMVTGMTGSFNGFFQIDGVDSFEVLSRDNALPTYQSVTLEEIASNGEEYESELIQVRGLMFNEQGAFAASTTYQIGDQGGVVALRTPSASDTRIAGVDIPQEAAIFRGVLGQFDNEDPRDSGYQLTPIAEMDVVVQGDAGQLVINEILYDPAADLAGDANGDGTRDGSEDEFVEIVNAGTSSVDLGGFVIEDGASLDSDDATFIRHRFPVGTVLEAGQAVVVFGGGAPAGNFGTSLVQTASNGSLGLNNGGDTVTLAESAIASNMGGSVIATVTYDGSVEDQSIARVPDLTGDFAAHTSNPQNPVRFSPGVSNLTGGGGGFPSAGEETPNGELALIVANPLRSNAQVRFETPASGDVSLVLYDALGRQVAVLAEGDLAAGSHTASLRTSALAPGVYVLRLAASGEQMTRTLTVVR